jgi:hypothetical protein
MVTGTALAFVDSSANPSAESVQYKKDFIFDSVLITNRAPLAAHNPSKAKQFLYQPTPTEGNQRVSIATHEEAHFGPAKM